MPRDFGRLSLLQNVLIDLIDLLDPDYVRTPHHLRSRTAMSPEFEALWRRPLEQSETPSNLNVFSQSRVTGLFSEEFPPSAVGE